MVFEREISFSTKGSLDMVDITSEVERVVRDSGIEEGMVLVFAPGATGAVITIENEPGLVEDFRCVLREIVKTKANYLHDRIDNNAASHLRASLLGAGKCFPISRGELVRGTWQHIFFVELDVKRRNRRLVVKVIGE